MEQLFQYKDKRLKLEVKKCGFLREASGLMFQRKQKAKALLFDLKKPMAIHSFFVFFPFVAIWLKDNKVVEVQKVKPFTFHIKPKKQFDELIEIPINNRYKEILKKLK